MTPELQDHVFARLEENRAADQGWAYAILAALEGDFELAAHLDGQDVAKAALPARLAAPGVAPAEPPGVYVSSVTVEGFRGVGPAVTLKLPAGPGLVLVVGRNGSGKSSFAEGLELLLTGRNLRWEKRSKLWQDGWRNLHHSERVLLKAELVVAGEGVLAASRTWRSEDLAAGESTVARQGQSARPLEAMGWGPALTSFRPFLSYNELGSLLEEGPSRLYDALSSVLGLEELTAVGQRLAEARKARQQRVDEAKERAKILAAALQERAATAGDDRLESALRALKWPNWNLLVLESLATGVAAAGEPSLALLRELEKLRPPEIESVSAAVARLRAAEAECAAFAGTDAERSRRLAQMLDEALRFHRKHPGEDCPICGTAGTMSAAWQERTEAEVARLRSEALACDRAESARQACIREAQRLAAAPPACLAAAAAAARGLASLPEAGGRWQAWASARDLDQAGALADHLEGQVLELAEALTALVAEASAEAARREDAWRPVAQGIAEWLPAARAALAAGGRLAELKEAEKWWKEASSSIRDERFSPVAEQAMAIWKQLRLQSNVDLGGIELGGAAQRRRATLRVTVDGTPAEALGVMSQGELHALALSLFLPRATLPESPFRFLWIDDPVQSMDPARVEGLARALAETAKSRQVVVFTHDDRLPEAVRRLGIPATVTAVTRRANSAVEVRPMADPPSAHLDDALALARTGELPPQVAGRVVPGFCRAAVEAACMEKVRRRRLLRGEQHEEVEALLTANAKTHPLMALALFDDESRTGDVLPRLNRSGRAVADTFQRLKAGAHEGAQGDLVALVKNAESIVRLVRESGP